MSLSRSGSPSKGFTPSVNLDNLETLQDRWAKQTDGLKHPPPPPMLNSPRSLKACQLCGFNADHDLEKRSLKQQLTRVLGDPSVDAAVAALSEEVETKAAMQVAVLAFQRAAIGMGTAKEKLVAYEAFRRQEEQRVPRLASAREVRRQMLAEEAYNRRRKVHAECSSERSNLSGSHWTNDSGGSSKKRPATNTWSNTAATAAANSPAERSSPFASAKGEWRSRKSSRVSSREASAQVSPTAGATANRRRSLDGQGRSTSPTSPGRSLNDFLPSPSSDGYLPYVPRNAASLNANYFGNRTFSATVSNPSRTPLAKAAAEGEETARRSLRGSSSLREERWRESSRGGRDDPMSGRRQQQALASHTVPFAEKTDGATEESVNVGKISPGGRNDLSIASINSSQLGWVLDGSQSHPSHGTSAAVTRREEGPQGHQSAAAAFTPASAVVMFHDKEHGQLPAATKTTASQDPLADAKRQLAAQPNKSSTPPRLSGAAKLKAVIEAKKQQKAKSGDSGVEAAKPPKPTNSAVTTNTAPPSVVHGEPARKANSQMIACKEPGVTAAATPHAPQDAFGEDRNGYFLFCANPVPYCRA